VYGVRIDSSFPNWLLPLVSLIGGLFLLKWTKLDRKEGFQWLFGLMTSIAMFFAALALLVLNSPDAQSDHFSNQDYAWIIGQVLDPPAEKDKSVQVLLCVDYAFDSSLSEASGKVVVSGKIELSTTLVDLNQFTAGNYFLVLQNKKRTVTGKFVLR